MKHLAAAALIALLPIPVAAQQTPPAPVIPMPFPFPFPPSMASINCGDRDMIIERLRSKYSEDFSARGIASSGDAIVEVLHNTKDGSWTILRVDANGRACIIAHGTNWDVLVPKTPAELIEKDNDKI